jgi:hypothetical protein
MLVSAPGRSDVADRRRVAHALVRVAREATTRERIAYLRLAAALIGDLHPATASRLLRLASALLAGCFPDEV